MHAWNRTKRLFLCIRSGNADKFTAVGCHDLELNADRKGRKEFYPVCFSLSASTFALGRNGLDVV